MSISKRKILITGGAGFFGTHLAERYCNRAKVVIFDSFLRDSLSFIPSLKTHPNIEVIKGDVLDPISLDNAFDGVDTVIHLAAIAGVSSYYEKSLDTLKVNIIGTVKQTSKVV